MSAQALVPVAKQRAIADDADDIEQMIFNGPYSVSIHLLIGFGFELFLKAAYLCHGGSAAKLGQGGIGHSLPKALSMAEKTGFRSCVGNLGWLIDSIHESHRRNYFRYGGLPGVSMPELTSSLPALETLGREVQIPLRRLLAEIT